MADLDVTTALGVLVDVDDGRIADGLDGIPRLDHGDGEPADVSALIWLMYREPYRWVHQLEGERRWRLTYRGRDALKVRQS
jgi:hypothetical protein